MNKHISKYFLIVDLEATCSNDESIPRDEMEIIEIGAVLVKRDGHEFKEVSSFTTFIKPVKHGITPFCTELTSITQDEVDSGVYFDKGYSNFLSWIASFNISEEIRFCSWGNYDKNQLMKECAENDIDYIFKNHTNIKMEFKKVQEIRRPVGMAKALNLAELSINGKHHRGIDDAKNMRQLLPFIFGNEKIKKRGK